MARESYTTWEKIIRCAFPGNQRIRAGRPRCRVMSDPANANLAGTPKGTLIIRGDVTAALSNDTAEVYICTVANTTLVRID